MLATGVLIASLLQHGLVARPPEPPPRFRGPEAIEHPLDVKLAGHDARDVLAGSPGEWCPAGDDFLRWQAERERQARLFARPQPMDVGGPNIFYNNGVVVMEDDGTLTRNDRRPDLDGTSLEFTPQFGGGYTVAQVPLQYESATGVMVLANQRQYAEVEEDLGGFTFPFGGVGRWQMWITSTMEVAFVDPSAPGPAQLHLADVLADRTPRVGPFETGTSTYGWSAMFRELPDRAVITWRATDGAGLNLDVQAVLQRDGVIRFNYRSTGGVQHGSAVVVDGDPAWWNDRRSAGSVLDPLGDVTIPAPDGPAIDQLEVRGFQIATSELMDIEVQFAAPLPAATDGELEFAIELRDQAGGDVFSTLWAAWNDGAWAWTNVPVDIVGDTLRFHVQRSEMPLTDDTVNVVAWSGQDWNWVEATGVDLTFPVAPPDRLMRDFSQPIAGTVMGPLVESFTLPELLPGNVYDAFMRHFQDPRVDGLAIFQTFETDIVFYAGAYSTVGNAGADGIGTGSSTDPESPALLHMNKLDYGWNSFDEGKVLVLNHEYGHHWLYYPTLMEAGVPVQPLGNGHPAGWVHIPAAAPVFAPDDSSCMGGSTWTDNGDGTFDSPPSMVNHGYSWHELYFMGLADPTEATDFYYIRDSVPALPGAYWPPNASHVTGTRVDVTVQQFIDAMGPRVPAQSPRTDFIVPFVVVVRPGEWGQPDVDEAARQCQVWAPGFHAATVDRATVTCNRVGLRPPEATILTPATDITILPGDSVVFTGQGTDPDEDVVDLTWDFDAVAAPASGPGPVSVTYPTAGTYLVTLSARDSSGMDDATPDMRVITVACTTPEVVTGLRVAHDAARTITFSWDPLAPPPDEFALFSNTNLRTLFFNELAAGQSPLTLPMMPGRLHFFKVAARNLPDCLGALDP